MIKNFLKKILRHVKLKASTASSCLVSLNDVPILFQPTSLLLNEVALTFSGSVPPDNPPKNSSPIRDFPYRRIFYSILSDVHAFQKTHH